ncbi:chaperonin 10-like protein [Rhodotorula diobovata]|uniref:Chaperonin 10-like protein n=1 Tax=Rhodotorula diobovata TaxID=5288 RepID=A0A5C5G3P4_9BASI|nr:chaperonin 10-like protein [Rhodotorula diobovata]
MASPDAAHTFRAWTHRGPPFPSSLSLVEQHPPLPATLGPHELLVEVYAAALNPLDSQLANLALFRLPALASPHGIGCDFSGVVLARGTQVTNLSIGAQVMGVTVNPLASPNGGTLSQISVIDLSRSAVIPKPPHLSWTQAAALPLAFLTARTVLSPPYLVLPPSDQGAPAAPRTIVVLGASSAVGQHVVQLASKQQHLRVVATCSPRSNPLVASLGAASTLDYHSPDLASSLLALRPREGYLSIIDCAGGTLLLPHLSALLTPRTRAFQPGGSYTTIVGDKPSSARLALGGATTYLWCWRMLVRFLVGYWAAVARLCGGRPRYACVSFRRDAGWLSEVGGLTRERGDYEVRIEDEFAFEDVERAFERLNEGRARGKIVVRVKET